MKKELCSRSTRFLRRYLLLRGPHVCPLKIEIPFRLEDDRTAYGKTITQDNRIRIRLPRKLGRRPP